MFQVVQEYVKQNQLFLLCIAICRACCISNQDSVKPLTARAVLSLPGLVQMGSNLRGRCQG